LKIFITGGAGFIGSHLVDRLLKAGHKVTVYDNFSTGQFKFIENASLSKNFYLVDSDLLDEKTLFDSMRNHDFVFHLAANADVRFGIEHPRKDLEQNTIATHNVLEAMRRHSITKIAFSSTGSVYGESEVIPTPEDAPFPVQTSLYGASKLAGESLISAYSEGFGMQAWIFRFVSILGERYSHGHVYDFFKQLKKNPNQLNVLGDGSQKKSYLYIEDCISAMLCVIGNTKKMVNILNLGADEYVTVNDSISVICKELGVEPELIYTGGKRGWIGDNPFIWLECKRLRELGWTPNLGIRDAVRRTLQWLMKNEWVLDKCEE
jgi:UDP-glucose 4-epimerase